MKAEDIKVSNDKAIARFDKAINEFEELVRQHAELTDSMKKAVINKEQK